MPDGRDRSVSPGRLRHDGHSQEIAATRDDDEVHARDVASLSLSPPGQTDYTRDDHLTPPTDQQHQQTQDLQSHQRQSSPRIPSPRSVTSPRSWYQRCSELFSRRSSLTNLDATATHMPPEEEISPRTSFNLPRPPGPIDMTPRVSRRRPVDEGLIPEDPSSNNAASSHMSTISVASRTNNNDGHDASSFYIDLPPLSAVNTRDDAFILRPHVSQAERTILQKLEIIKRLAFVVCTLPVILALALYYQAQTLYWWLFLIPVVSVLMIILYRFRLIRRLEQLQIESLSRTSTLLSNNASRVVCMPVEVTIPVEDDIPPPPPTYQASLQMPPAYLSQLLRKVPSYSSFSSRLDRASTAEQARQAQESTGSPSMSTSSVRRESWNSSSHTQDITPPVEQGQQQQQQQPPNSSALTTREMVQTTQGASSLVRTVMEGQRAQGSDAETSSISQEAVVIDMPSSSTGSTS
ncbi:hypothetical protein BGW42_000794 [Actinomortierella wolfii]|nr:hypothetical protein BGW42_000794 [Actinomortierella wolfii]